MLKVSNVSFCLEEVTEKKYLNYLVFHYSVLILTSSPEILLYFSVVQKCVLHCVRGVPPRTLFK